MEIAVSKEAHWKRLLSAVEAVQCESSLGGLLNHYHVEKLAA